MNIRYTTNQISAVISLLAQADALDLPWSLSDTTMQYALGEEELPPDALGYCVACQLSGGDIAYLMLDSGDANLGYLVVCCDADGKVTRVFYWY